MFLAAMLLALASALVPALFPTGPASARLAGSAFDPTTSAVALRGRAQAIVRAEALRGDEPGKAAAAPGPLALPTAPLPETRHILFAPITAEPAPSPAPPMDARRVTQAQPRAPPHAIV